MYVRNCWYVAAWAHELAENQLISRTVINEPIVLYRNKVGDIVGLEDRCCHRLAPLSHGRIEGNDLRCRYHGLKFNSSGACVEIPMQQAIPPQARVRSYPAVEKHSWIWIWMGDSSLADTSLIPAAVGLDDPHWTLRSGQMDFEANYQLINDNLTDLTHVRFLHPTTFLTPESFPFYAPMVERLDRGIRIWRWLPATSTKSPEKICDEGGDLWTAYDYLVPGIMLMPTVNVAFPKGTAERLGGGRPDVSNGTGVRGTLTSQAITPITDHTSRYFYSWGPSSGEGSDAAADSLLALAKTVFLEDKEMIEAQQRIINFDPGRKELLFGSDAGPVKMRSVIQHLVKAETAAASISSGKELHFAEHP
jgi:phenylpropionate dioxygenase-like ring-hydroxylating dioxygenase large terminal subunit